ncbi:MAG: formylglycine-generating enzyme family protein [Candidatus Marinimicrobia bacterium]|nr:formylglycine-generating enzyme family protein [Candidatus Neomarinimicrobiota bacterium]
MKTKAWGLALILVFALSYASEPGHIQVISEPGVTVFLDGIFRGVTSEEMNGLVIEKVSPGPHVLKAVKEGGFNPRESTVTVMPGQVLSHEVGTFALKIRVTEKEDPKVQRFGSLSIQSSPVSLRISIPALPFSAEKSKETWTAEQIPVGTYEVLFTSNNATLKAEIGIYPNWLSDYQIDMGTMTVTDRQVYIAPENRMAEIEMILVKVPGGPPAGTYIGKYEVTQALYESVMNTNPSYFKGADLPVETVSWYDALVFCNRLSELCDLEPVYTIRATGAVMDKGKNGFRLPLEKEWERAGAAGTDATNCFSGASTYALQGLKKYAWYAANSKGTTHPVGSKLPNALAFHDMSGNVWEWCWEDSRGTSLTGDYRKSKGGSWSDEGEYNRVSKTHFFSPSYSSYSLGFRLARNAE